MAHQILGDKLQPFLRANHRLKRRPFGFQLLPPLHFLVLCHLLELRINFRPFVLVEFQVREAALVVDGDRGLIVDGALDVVDADVIAKNRARVGVGLLDGSAGKSDERCVGQSVAHALGEAVNEVVLAAVGFVRDHHDVVPL